MKHLKFTFHSPSSAVEAYRVLLSIFKGTKDEQDLYAQDTFDFQRALVVCSHKADDWTELTLREGDIVCVVTKNGQPVNNITHTMWLGECEGINGWFPINNVELLDEPEVNKSLQQQGYKSLQDLPTKEDWEFLLLGINYRSFNPGDIVLSPVCILFLPFFFPTNLFSLFILNFIFLFCFHFVFLFFCLFILFVSTIIDGMVYVSLTE